MSGVITSIGGFLAANAAALTAGGALASAGLGVGEVIHNATDGSGSSSTGASTLAQQQAALQAQQKTAFQAAQPNVQSATSGSLTPQALNAATGNAAGVPSADLNALLAALSKGGGSTPNSAPFSGGITPGQQQPPPNANSLEGLSELLRG